MNSEIHEGVKCDSCGKENITGVRYKCMECPNYDMCESCMAKPRGTTIQSTASVEDRGHTSDHMILRVPKWSQTKKFPLLANREQWINKGIQCYHCNKQNIFGWRYLCVQCGINICEVCERTGEHTLAHPLLKMVPIQEPVSNVPGITFIQSQPAQSLFSGFSAQPAQPLLSGFSAQPATQQPAQQPLLSGFSAQPAPSFGFTAQQTPQQSPFGFTAQQTPQQSPFGFTNAQQTPQQQSPFGFTNAQQTPQQSPFGFTNSQQTLQFGGGTQQNIFGKK